MQHIQVKKPLLIMNGSDQRQLHRNVKNCKGAHVFILLASSQAG